MNTVNKSQAEVLYHLFKLYAEVPYLVEEKDGTVYKSFKLPFFFFRFRYTLVIKESKMHTVDLLYRSGKLILESQTIFHEVS